MLDAFEWFRLEKSAENRQRRPPDADQHPGRAQRAKRDAHAGDEPRHEAGADHKRWSKSRRPPGHGSRRVGRRLTSLDERASALEIVDKKIKTLHDTVRHAQEAAERVVGPESDLQKHRDALKQLLSQTLETRRVDTPRKSRRLSKICGPRSDRQPLDSANALKTG